MADVSWVTAFLDLPADDHDRGVAFWEAVTGYSVSTARGDHGEFATLVPPAGEPFLRTQRLGAGGPRVHLDLHVAEPLDAAMEAVTLGAREVARPGYVVLASPGGLPFCLVPAAPAVGPRTPPASWPGGASLVDQVCLDLPPRFVDAEIAFWAGLTGWPLSPSPRYAEFANLTPPAGLPLHLLLQRLDDDVEAVTAHLDLAVEDRAAETDRHVALGGTVVAVRAGWTVLHDPVGSAYCLTDRRPA